MLPNDDLARWGEPPTDELEMALAELLAEVMQNAECRVQNDQTAETPSPPPSSNLQSEICNLQCASRWIEEMMATIVDRAGVLENLPPPADAGGQARPVELRLSVSRLVAGVWEAIASTHPQPCVVRDLRRVPDNPDRVTPRTGERVRIEATSDRTGHLLVFNVGPRGGINVLYPARPGETGLVAERETVFLADVELTPPAGRERVYAVWSRVSLSLSGARLRDMRRVEESLTKLRPEDWHAVLLELDHAG